MSVAFSMSADENFCRSDLTANTKNVSADTVGRCEVYRKLQHLTLICWPDMSTDKVSVRPICRAD